MPKGNSLIWRINIDGEDYGSDIDVSGQDITNKKEVKEMVSVVGEQIERSINAIVEEKEKKNAKK